MTALFRTLHYDQNGFPWESAMALVRKRSAPMWTQLACLLATLVMIMPVTLASLPRPGNWSIVGAIPILCLIGGWLALKAINRRFSQTAFRDMADAPYRSGPRTLDLSAEGIAIASPTSRWHYPWSHIREVFAGPEGTVLIMLGHYQYEPVGGNAFTTLAERDAFVAAVRDKLANITESAV